MSQRTSAAGDLQVEWTSAAGNLETEGVPEIKGTSAPAEHTEIEEDPQIKGTSAAAEHAEIEWTSATKNPPIDSLSTGPPSYLPPLVSWKLPAFTGGKGLLSAPMPLKLGTSAAAEHTEREEKTHWPKSSIFRVPEHIRSGRESIFEPQLVSIGPYFFGRKELERMENLKIRCNEEILKMLGIGTGEDKRSGTDTNHLRPPPTDTNHLRPPTDTNHLRPPPTDTNHLGPPKAGNPHKRRFIFVTSRTSLPRNHKLQKDTGFDKLFLQFEKSGRDARDYYKEEFNNISHVEFVRMLFLDSCFIIRTIFALSQQTQSMSFLDVHIKAVRSDLLLLDNQIPLFFIKEVYEWFLKKLKDKNLPDFYTVLEPFICMDMPWAINQDAKYSEAAHLLDLYWRYSLPPKMYEELTSSPPQSYRSETERDLSNSSKIDPSKENALMVIANATELQQMAGIEFQKCKHEGHLDVTFSKAFFKGIIWMPQLKIDFRQRTLLTNLIVFENCIVPRMRAISCYMKLMDALINSENDVELLQNSGVIHNTLRSHQMAATFFNDIGDFCFTDDNENLFSGLYTDVKKYYDSSWHRRLASLRHNYFNSPWAGISFFAALILLGLSVVQTLYTVYGYYKPSN